MAAVVVAHLIITIGWRFVVPAMSSIFLATVMIVALYAGRGPAILATILAGLDSAYSFMQPYESVRVGPDDVIRLSVFMMAGLVVSSLQERRRRAEMSLRKARDELEDRVTQRTADLVRSQEQLRLLINDIKGQAFFMLDGAGMVTSWNDGAERLFEFRAHEISGRHYSALVPDKDLITGEAGRWLQGPPGSFEDQGWVSRRDGRQFWGVILVSHMQESKDHSHRYAVAIRDVTEQRSLEREVLEISERERRRIGHDLHDGLGQELAGIALLATVLADRLAKRDVGDARDAEKVAELVHSSIQHTRELARGLCPVDLEMEGICDGLRGLADRASLPPALLCSFATDSEIQTDATVTSHLFRIAQEAINNAIRHGKASRIAIRLAESNGNIVLTISDNGVGFPSDISHSGLGLRLMSHRAKMIRGSINVRRGENGGTIVSCEVGQQQSIGRAMATQETT